MTAKPLKFSKSGGKATIGKQYLASLVQEQDLYSLFGMGDMSHLFQLGELEIYQFMVTHAKKHNKIPSLQTIAQVTGSSLPEVIENVSYYRNMAEQRHIDLKLRKSLLGAQNMLLDKSKEPEDALNKLAEQVMQLRVQKQSGKIIDYREAQGLLMSLYVKEVMQANKGIKTGWPTYDKMSGGIRAGDLLSIVGRPAAGKSFLMIWAAYKTWKQGLPTLLVSMEMKPEVVLQRLVAIDASIPIGHIKSDGMAKNQQKKFKFTLSEASKMDVPFYVVDGNLSSTVEDIWSLVTTLQPAALWVDGGYLVKHPSVRDRYQRVAENVELMKSELASLCPTAVSWQFSREAAKKSKAKQATDPGMEDIGYSDAIPQVSSIVLGMMQDDSIETAKERRVKILKGRNGESGEFKINWSFSGVNPMDFSELENKAVEDLQFL